MRGTHMTPRKHALLSAEAMTNIRNPVKCRVCDEPLLVECLQIGEGSPNVQPVSFPCPACNGWNQAVPLHGREVLSVIREPRSHPRE